MRSRSCQQRSENSFEQQRYSKAYQQQCRNNYKQQKLYYKQVQQHKQQYQDVHQEASSQNQDQRQISQNSSQQQYNSMKEQCDSHMNYPIRKVQRSYKNRNMRLYMKKSVKHVRSRFYCIVSCINFNKYHYQQPQYFMRKIREQYKKKKDQIRKYSDIKRKLIKKQLNNAIDGMQKYFETLSSKQALKCLYKDNTRQLTKANNKCQQWQKQP